MTTTRASSLALLTLVAVLSAQSSASACSRPPDAPPYVPNDNDGYSLTAVALGTSLAVGDAAFFLLDAAYAVSDRGGISRPAARFQRAMGYLHGTVGTGLLLAGMLSGVSSCGGDDHLPGRLMKWGGGMHALAAGLITFSYVAERRVTVSPIVQADQGSMWVGLQGRF